ncbi:MAG: chlorite dismutase family protein [Thermus sp.]
MLWAFSLFRLLPEFRRLEAEVQEHLKEELSGVFARWQAKGGFLALYSLVGLSAEADLLLWQGAADLRAFQALRREMHRTRLLGYLEPVALYLDRGGEPGPGFLALFPFGLEGIPRRGLGSSAGRTSWPWKGLRSPFSPWPCAKAATWGRTGPPGRPWTSFSPRPKGPRPRRAQGPGGGSRGLPAGSCAGKGPIAAR